MPELPEVETIVRDLREDIVGKKIRGARFLTTSVWRNRVPPAKMLVGASFERLERKGKNILLFLSNGRVLVVHLKMTGRLTVEDPATPLRKHTHFVIALDHSELRFNDIRRFGYLDLVDQKKLNDVAYLSKLGPDALTISRDTFINLIRSKKRS